MLKLHDSFVSICWWCYQASIWLGAAKPRIQSCGTEIHFSTLRSFFFFLKGFCSTHCCSTEVFNCHCDDLLIFKEVVEANVFQVQPMDKVRYSLTISSNHNQLAPENMFYLALSQPLCLQVICTPTEKSW